MYKVKKKSSIVDYSSAVVQTVLMFVLGGGGLFLLHEAVYGKIIDFTSACAVYWNFVVGIHMLAISVVLWMSILNLVMCVGKER